MSTTPYRPALVPRLIALVSAVLSTIVWWGLVWTSALGPGGESTPPAIVAALLFPGLAWAGVVAAQRGAALVTLLTGLIGMMPVGLYFLVAPGPLRLIGIAPLLMLAAGVWLVRDLRREEV